MKPVVTSPLLSLIDASAQLRAGMGPSCAVIVRLLDRVHFTVHTGDCVVVHHHDPAAARVLLAALAGHRSLRASHLLSGERVCPPWLRIRRTAIRSEAIAAVLAGWRDVADAPAARCAEPVVGASVSESAGASLGASAGASKIPSLPAVHLLRASRDGLVTRHEWRQWCNWARRERARGGAVVIVARPQEARMLPPHTEPWLADESLPYATGWSATRRVRELLLQYGQLRNLREWQ